MARELQYIIINQDGVLLSVFDIGDEIMILSDRAENIEASPSIQEVAERLQLLKPRYTTWELATPFESVADDAFVEEFERTVLASLGKD